MKMMMMMTMMMTILMMMMICFSPSTSYFPQHSLRENFKTAAGQLSHRLKIFAGQKKNCRTEKKKKKKKAL